MLHSTLIPFVLLVLKHYLCGIVERSLSTLFLGYGAAFALVPLKMFILDVVALGAPLPVVHHHGNAELLLDECHAVWED